jgi:hypothetical protein
MVWLVWSPGQATALPCICCSLPTRTVGEEPNADSRSVRPRSFDALVRQLANKVRLIGTVSTFLGRKQCRLAEMLPTDWPVHSHCPLDNSLSPRFVSSGKYCPDKP